MDFNQLLEMLAAHQWEAVGGLAVGSLVATAKQGWLGTKIQAFLPSRFIPFLAPLYAVLGVVAADLVLQRSGVQILSDAGTAVMSAFAAVLGHQVLIEGVRNGAELVPRRAPSEPPTV
jgi:hypothetical protein